MHDDHVPAYFGAAGAGSDALEPTVSATPFAQRIMAILWPSFLMAGVLEMLVFAFADPADLHWMGGAPVQLSRSAVYSLAFFAFWLLISTAGALTLLLLQEPGQVNRVSSRARLWP
ncbi:MAG: hypothetical protein RL722_563 [Pseudomonadota bacterium]